MTATEVKDFNTPDSTMPTVPRMHGNVLAVGDASFVRMTVDPGWRWSVDVGPLQQADRCQLDHVIYLLSGSVATLDADGGEVTLTGGQLAHIAPGHDGWTVGDEPAVWIEFPH